MQRLAAKTAIITGGTMGIGEATVRRFLAEGAKVVGIARNNERGQQLINSLDAGPAVKFVAGDVADPSGADAAVSAASELGGVDVLVDNAAVDFTSDLLATDDDEVQRVFEVNFFGTYLMFTRVVRAMKGNGGGSIINVTSRLASIGVPTMVVYSATKGAVLSFTRGAAVELAPHGIRVNAVAPDARMRCTICHGEWRIFQEPDRR